MGRTGRDKGKGKEPARPSKKTKRVLRDEDSEEEDPLWHDETVEEQVDRIQYSLRRERRNLLSLSP